MELQILLKGNIKKVAGSLKGSVLLLGDITVDIDSFA
jgi:hypothetical protein